MGSEDDMINVRCEMAIRQFAQAMIGLVDAKNARDMDYARVHVFEAINLIHGATDRPIIPMGK